MAQGEVVPEFAVIVPVLPGSDLSLAHLVPLSCHPVIP